MSDAINEIKPGVPLTEEQKAALAKSNLESSTEAHRLAAEHRSRDQQEGRGEPAVKTVADLLMRKLENEEFQHKDPNATPNQPASNS